jgi:ketosteroid isomerase-like protein
MKMLIGSLTLVLLLGTVPVVWAQADPAKEVADIGLKRGQAGARGDVDGVLADLADNVVITSARSGFRMEGKEAYRTFLTNLYQNYPTRQGLTRQVTRAASFRKATSSWSTVITTRHSLTRTGSRAC